MIWSCFSARLYQAARIMSTRTRSAPVALLSSRVQAGIPVAGSPPPKLSMHSVRSLLGDGAAIAAPATGTSRQHITRRRRMTTSPHAARNFGLVVWGGYGVRGCDDSAGGTKGGQSAQRDQRLASGWRHPPRYVIMRP